MTTPRPQPKSVLPLFLGVAFLLWVAGLITFGLCMLVVSL